MSTSVSHAVRLPANGDSVAHYTVHGQLGAGGMGAVFLAWDGHLRRYVALKVMHAVIAGDSEARERFLREARAAAGVAHDNVVTVYQVGVDPDRDLPYIAMPYLQGTPLDHYLAEHGPLSVPEVVRIGREAAAGLGAAHAVGLVHRDIKPGNLFLEAPANRVKVLDFGLAKPADPAAPTLTTSGLVVGTPQYMAPEQARGQTLDPRADLFSLGCVLYELCTGKPPFDGITMAAVLTALAVDTPPPVTARNPAVPPRLAALIDRMLAKDPAARPTSATEVIAELDAIAQGAPPRSEVPTVRTTPPPVARETPRRSLRPLLFVAVGLAVCAAVFVGTLLATRDRPPAADASTPPTEPPPAPAPVAGPKPVKVFLLAGQSNMTGKARARTVDWIGHDPKQAWMLEKLRHPDGAWVERDDVWVDARWERHGQAVDKFGPLSMGFGDTDAEFGPELMFGHTVGDFYDEPVVLVKVTQGGLALAAEGRPPSSGGRTGPFYLRMIDAFRATVERLPQKLPELAGRGFEVAGFVWVQEWNDSIKGEYANEYEFNLANLIRDVRKDLGRPRLPVVVGEMGIGGASATGGTLAIRKAQAAATSRQEFAGTVALAKTVDLWDDEADALVKQGFDARTRKWRSEELQRQFDRMGADEAYHYLGSGKIFAGMGHRLGEAMTKLLPR